jgi:hypothetical protein
MNFHPNTRGLRPLWKKGDPSPNPSGRPKRLPISDTLAEMAVQPVPTSIRKLLERRGVTLAPNATYADALARSEYLEAFNGNCAAAKEIREAIEGKAGQRIEPVDAADREVRIRVVYSEAPVKNKGALTEPMNSKVDEGTAKTPTPGSP